MLKVTKAELFATTVLQKDFPKDGNPEIALAGRSNVGKSSLINNLVNRRNLARTSGQPGKTQTINFYHINDSFYFVDLPGYGFARVPQSIKAKWGQIIEGYLANRPELVAVFLLLDMRHEPTADDVKMYQWLYSINIPPVIIATKADKISRGKWPVHVKVIRQKLGLSAAEKVIPFSAESGAGKEELLSYIKNAIGLTTV